MEQFNSTLIDFADQLSLVCPNSIISNNIDTIKSILKSHPKKIIELFIIYVLPDKEKIDIADHDYFLKKSYEDAAKDSGVPIQKVFEFKSIWIELTPENQNFVIQYMQ